MQKFRILIITILFVLAQILILIYSPMPRAIAGCDNLQLLSPAMGEAWVPVTSLKLSWSPCDDAVSYQLWMKTDTKFVISESLATPEYKYSGKLDHDTDYTWAVKAIGAKGQDMSSWVYSRFHTEKDPASPICCVHVVNEVSPEGIPLSLPLDSDSFPEQTPNLYLSFKINNAFINTAVKAQWKLDSGTVLFEDSAQVTGTRYIAFGHAVPDGGWPLGHYTISLQLNGKDTARTQFTISNYLVHHTVYFQLLYPLNEAATIPVTGQQFSWSPFARSTKYEINLARDAYFKQMVLSDTTGTTVYQHRGKFDYSSTYFWRILPLELYGEPIPGFWSATYTFKTEPEPPVPPADTTSYAGQTSLLIWILIIAGITALILTVFIVVIMRKRRIKLGK